MEGGRAGGWEGEVGGCEGRRARGAIDCVGNSEDSRGVAGYFVEGLGE